MGEERPIACQQCGNPVQPVDRFCGVCGAAVLPPAPQVEQVIPRPVAAAQAPSRSNGRPLLLAGILGALAVLVVGGGALAFVGFGVGSNLLGGTEQNPPSSSDNQGVAPSEPEITQTPDVSQEPTYQTEDYGTTEPTSAPPLLVTSTPEPTTSTGSYGQSTEEIEADAEEAAEDYYRAVGVGDWRYTYDHLDSSTQSRFTRDEWFKKNQWYAGNGSVIFYIESVQRQDGTSEPIVEVTVRLTFEDGSTSIRNTFFVYEDGSWKHRFSQEEYDLYMPDASYEEFVEAQQ